MDQQLGAQLRVRCTKGLKGKLKEQAGELRRDLSSHARDLLEIASDFDADRLQALSDHLGRLIEIKRKNSKGGESK